MNRKPDWSRKLPRAIDVRGHMVVRTLSDVRAFLLKLSPERQQHTQWQSVAAAALEAAKGGSVEAVLVALQLALQIARVEYRMR